MSDLIIIDSSVAIKWVVPEIGSKEALALRLKYDLCAPELIIPEIANILWKKFQRGELSAAEAGLAAELLANSGISYASMRGLLEKATDFALALGHPAYDCVYLAAALEANCPFVTADARLIRKPQQQQFAAVKCYDLLAMPAL
ncbi:type II toxin-antitoxin system VapC family toxin [Rhizobium sp. KVB221]|uniref:Ribonuclease VapC n=1 Tax=Rhizobium setariae TaxID=2801340 RepID=A0A936YHT6_9HYPH|nr:type II toxin-antitoxin system VapC family toxin [Rhizobium setariae]